MQFETKIAIVVRDDLATWQKLNVTAFLTSGLVGAASNPPGADLLGEAYRDADGNLYNALAIQPMIVLSANGTVLRKIFDRAMNRNAKLSIYTEEMFATGHDAANRATVAQHPAADLPIVGLALREERKLVDKITKGAKMHP